MCYEKCKKCKVLMSYLSHAGEHRVRLQCPNCDQITIADDSVMLPPPRYKDTRKGQPSMLEGLLHPLDA